MINLAIIISGTGRTLQNLINHQKAGKLPVKIVGVISSVKNTLGVQKAKAAGLPTVIIERRLCQNIKDFSNKITNQLSLWKPDLVVLAGFIHFWKIPKEFRWKVINIHPALLPKFGGKGYYGEKVHRSVIEAGEKESGCTVHFANNRYDRGLPILSRRVPVFKDDTPKTLAARVFKEECIALPEAIRLFAERKIQIVKGKVLILSPTHET